MKLGSSLTSRQTEDGILYITNSDHQYVMNVYGEDLMHLRMKV